MKPSTNDIRICFLGESFVNGTGDRTYLGWTGRLCVNLSQRGNTVTYYNLGIRRETSTELLQRWQPEVNRRLPADCDRRLVFSFGVNDTTVKSGQQRVELADSLANTHQILQTAQQQFPVLMIGPPPIADAEQNTRIQLLSRHLAALCTDLSIPYLDVFLPLQQSEIWQREVAAGDGAHPDAGGYAEFAQLVQNWAGWMNWLG
jgi:lysophospholipase L1-like esterase